MIAVIIAGGSGTRLWPLSTPEYPKHLLKVNGDSESLLQKTYSRVGEVADTVYVLTEQSHAHHVKSQLENIPAKNLIIEPARRGTANCLIEALSVIKAQGRSKDEPVLILWADHYIRDIDGFKRSMKVAASASVDSGKIALIGIEPDHPATGFGYIEKGTIIDDSNFVFEVSSFKEKPNYETAKQYVKSGNYLWNCGYFIATTKVFEGAMSTYSPTLYANYTKLVSANSGQHDEVYTHFESENIDNALIERVKDLVVVPANFDWIDLGSYNDLHKVAESDEQLNHTHGERINLKGVENSFIHNGEDKPIAVIGLDNIVVVNTPDGILVARKDLSQQVGEVSKMIQKQGEV
jgi:mannose-1-phosphate guanylyltransferase